MIRIIKLRRKLKKSSRGRLNINSIERLTPGEDIKNEMKAFIKLFLKCEDAKFINLKIILFRVFWRAILKALLICGIDVGSRLFFSICIANVLDKVKESNFNSAF